MAKGALIELGPLKSATVVKDGLGCKRLGWVEQGWLSLNTIGLE